MLSAIGGSTLVKLVMVPRAETAVIPDSAKERPSLRQARGSLWHPQPELWSLHLWSLDGSLCSSLLVWPAR